MALTTKCSRSITNTSIDIERMLESLNPHASQYNIPGVFIKEFESHKDSPVRVNLQQSPPPRPTTPKPKAAVTRSTVEDFMVMEYTHREFMDLSPKAMDTTPASIRGTSSACSESSRRASCAFRYHFLITSRAWNVRFVMGPIAYIERFPDVRAILRAVFWLNCIPLNTGLVGLSGAAGHHLFPGRDAMDFLADIIVSIDWKQTSLLFDISKAREASLLTDILSMKGIKVSLHTITMNESNTPFLDFSYHHANAKNRNYVLLANQKSMGVLFKELNLFDEPGLSPTSMKLFSKWLVWGDGLTPDFLKNEVDNMKNVAMLERHRRRPDAKNNSRVLQVNSTLRLSAAVWHPGGQEFQTVFRDRTDKFPVSETQIFPNMNYRLNQMRLVVSTLTWPMYAQKSVGSNGEVTYAGLCMDLLKELAQKLNFSYTLGEPADREWGRKVRGRWTGLMGDVVYKRADLVVAPISAQEERAEVVDFTTAYYTDYNEIIMQMPDTEKTRWFILLRPFTWPVFLAVAAVFPFVTLTVWVCEKWSPLNWTSRSRIVPIGLHRLEDCFWYMLGVLLHKSGAQVPSAASGRTVVAFWWLFGVMLVAIYCGMLMAGLTVTRETKPFHSIAEMLAQTEYKWGANNGTYILELMKTSFNKEYRQMWERMELFAQTDPSVLHVGLQEQIDKVEGGNYAFITDSTAVASILPVRCDLVKADERFLMLQSSIALRKNSAYTGMFSESVVALVENGLTDMWANKWRPKAPPCPSLLKAEAKKIMLIDVQSAYYVLFAGIAVSLSFLLAERLCCVPKIETRVEE